MSRLEDIHAAKLRGRPVRPATAADEKARLEGLANEEETKRKLQAELNRLISLLERLGAPGAEKLEYTDFSTWRRAGVFRPKRPSTRVTGYGWKLYERVYTIRPEVDGHDIYHLWVDGTIRHGIAPRSISSLNHHEAKGILAGITSLIARYDPPRQ